MYLETVDVQEEVSREGVKVKLCIESNMYLRCLHNIAKITQLGSKTKVGQSSEERGRQPVTRANEEATTHELTAGVDFSISPSKLSNIFPIHIYWKYMYLFVFIKKLIKNCYITLDKANG